MKICVITNEDLSFDRGPCVVLRNLIKEWSETNDVTLITPSDRNRFFKGVNVIGVKEPPYVQARKFDFLWLLYSLAIQKRLIEFDVIVDQVFTIPLLLLGTLRKKSVFCLMHGDQYLEAIINREHLLARIKSYLFQRISVIVSSRIITVSDLAKQYLIRDYGHASKIFVVENGVDLQLFRKVYMEKEPFILFVGNSQTHFQRKGIPILLNSFSLLVKEYPNISLVFTGVANKRIADLTRVLGISKDIRFTGFLTSSKLVELYNRALVVVLPSVFDTYGLVVNESMACGTPVVISDQTGASEIVRAANSGLIFRSGDTNSLYDALTRLITNDKLRQRMADDSLRFAHENLGWEKVSQKYLDFFRENSKAD